MCERWGIPLDIQQKGVTPVSTVLWAATGIVTLCTVDVVVVSVGSPYCSLLYKNSHSQSIFLPLSQGHQQSQAVFGWSQIISLHGLSSKYGNMRLTLQWLQVFLTKVYNEKYRNATYITVFDGVCQFLTTLSGMELLHNLQRCTHALTYTIHSRYTPALAVFLELLECVFSSTVCCWKLSTSLRHGQTSVGEGEEWVRGRRKHFSFGQAKNSTGIMHLCRGCEAADYACKALKNFDGSLVCCTQSMRL